MKKLSHLFLALGLIFTFGFGLSGALGLPIDSLNEVAYAAPKQSVFGSSESINADAGSVREAATLIDRLKQAANVFAAVVLAISIIMIIVGGLRYILSSGDERAAQQGKMIVLYSFIGIVIALSAFALARLFASFGF